MRKLLFLAAFVVTLSACSSAEQAKVNAVLVNGAADAKVLVCLDAAGAAIAGPILTASGDSSGDIVSAAGKGAAAIACPPASSPAVVPVAAPVQTTAPTAPAVAPTPAPAATLSTPAVTGAPAAPPVTVQAPVAAGACATDLPSLMAKTRAQINDALAAGDVATAQQLGDTLTTLTNQYAVCAPAATVPTPAVVVAPAAPTVAGASDCPDGIDAYQATDPTKPGYNPACVAYFQSLPPNGQ